MDPTIFLVWIRIWLFRKWDPHLFFKNIFYQNTVTVGVKAKIATEEKGKLERIINGKWESKKREEETRN